MIFDVIMHQYFWLSFLPISLLGAGFWMLLFDRADGVREPIFFLVMALVAGMLSALFVSLFTISGALLWVPFQEEISKIFCSILFIEIFQRRFVTVSQGMMYGFGIGMGFALVENIWYLSMVYDQNGFLADFWLTFQGRFWMSSLLHGSVTALFGALYAGTYLFASTVKRRESPILALVPNFSLRQMTDIFTLHATVRHIFAQTKSQQGHYSRAVIWEGVWLCYLVHLAFNLLLQFQLPFLAFCFSFIWMVFLYRSSRWHSSVRI